MNVSTATFLQDHFREYREVLEERDELLQIQREMKDEYKELEKEHKELLVNNVPRSVMEDLQKQLASTEEERKRLARALSSATKISMDAQLELNGRKSSRSESNAKLVKELALRLDESENYTHLLQKELQVSVTKCKDIKEEMEALKRVSRNPFDSWTLSIN